MASNDTQIPRKKGGALKNCCAAGALLVVAGGAFLLAKREIDGGTRQGRRDRGDRSRAAV